MICPQKVKLYVTIYAVWAKGSRDNNSISGKVEVRYKNECPAIHAAVYMQL